MNDELKVEPILIMGKDGKEWVHPLIAQYALDWEKTYEFETETIYSGNLFLIRLANKKSISDSFRAVVVYTFDKHISFEESDKVFEAATVRLFSGDFGEFFNEDDVFDECSISPDVGVSDYGDGCWGWNT